jgi:hypothetical protein
VCSCLGSLAWWGIALVRRRSRVQTPPEASLMATCGFHPFPLVKATWFRLGLGWFVELHVILCTRFLTFKHKHFLIGELLSTAAQAAARSRGFLTYQNAGTAFSRAADTVGTSAHTTYGEDISGVYQVYLSNGPFVCGLHFSHLLSSGFTYRLSSYYPLYSHSAHLKPPTPPPFHQEDVRGGFQSRSRLHMNLVHQHRYFQASLCSS